MGISDITSSMKTAAIVLALALGVSCDTLGGHSHGHGHGLRQGRQEEALGAYGQPQYGDDLDTGLSVKFSTSVLLMELEVLPSTASCVPMEQSSTRTTSSATGGSTLTALRLRDSILSMMNMLLRGLLLMLLPVMPRLTMLPPLLILDMLLLLNMKVLKVLAELGVRDLQAVLTGDNKANSLVLTTLMDQNLKTLCLYF